MKRLFLLLSMTLACAVSFAQSAGERESFETMKNAAYVHIQNGDFTAAKAQYNAIFKLYGKYQDLTNQVRPEYERCIRELDRQANAKKESERLAFSEPFVNFPYSTDAHSITITAGKGGTAKWEIDSCPAWCVPAREGSLLTLTVGANPDPRLRTGEVSIKMTVGSKVISRTIAILQVARPLESRSIRIITYPEGAQVTVGTDPTIRIAPFTLTVNEGEVPVHIMKHDFSAVDTYVNVSANDDAKAVKEYKFELTPKFSMVHFSLKAKSGKIDDKNPRFFIGDRPISLDGFYGRGGVKTFSSDDFISKYEFYQDWNKNFLIPLEPGVYTFKVKAEEFEDYVCTLTLKEGETLPLDILMEPKLGVVRFINGINSDGAVIKDGATPIGTIDGPTEIKLTADDHKIYIEKENFLSEKEFYPIHVSSKETLDVEVNMSPLAYVDFRSEPNGTEVYVNGEFVGLTPVLNKAVKLGENTITFNHKDYYPATLKKILTTVGQKEEVQVHMYPSHKLKISSDAFKTDRCANTGFNVYLKRLDGGDGAVVSIPGDGPDIFTDATINVPYGKYQYTLARSSRGAILGADDGIPLHGENKRKDIAYKGSFVFREGGPNEIRTLSYSENGNFTILAGNYYPSAPAFKFTKEVAGLSASQMADASFLKFFVWPGFSTSLVKGTVYNAQTPYSDSKYLFSGTCLLLNGEQRIGGSVWKYIDVNFLAAYSYLPHFDASRINGWNLDYVDGYDVFLGIEATSRIPIFNANFKLGYKLAGGNVNLFNGLSGDTRPEIVPFNYGGIVFSLGFTLGSYDCKGANTIRAWFL